MPEAMSLTADISLLTSKLPCDPSRMRSYILYGIRLDSSIPLPCPEQIWSGQADVRLFSASERFFSETCGESRSLCDDWFSHATLPDGSHYIRWTGLFEFLVTADGRGIACHALSGASLTAFQTYLVSQVLSFALLKQGFEPLHATVVVVKDQAVGFLGACGYGKSTLAAMFLQAGHRLLTDDVLVLDGPIGTTQAYRAHPGPARLKLFPEVADALLGFTRNGVPMNPGTDKLIIPVPPDSAARSPVPLKSLYVLASRARSGPTRVRIRRLDARRAWQALIHNTFNTMVVTPERLRQQFDFAATLARCVPVKALSFPSGLERLPSVIDAIACDISG